MKPKIIQILRCPLNIKDGEFMPSMIDALSTSQILGLGDDGIVYDFVLEGKDDYAHWEAISVALGE